MLLCIALWARFDVNLSAGQNFVCGELMHLRKAGESAAMWATLRALFRKQAHHLVYWDMAGGSSDLMCWFVYMLLSLLRTQTTYSWDARAQKETQLERKSLKLKFVCLSAAYSGTRRHGVTHLFKTFWKALWFELIPLTTRHNLLTCLLKTACKS